MAISKGQGDSAIARCRVVVVSPTPFVAGKGGGAYALVYHALKFATDHRQNNFRMHAILACHRPGWHDLEA
jgi:hypothetical protein